MFANRNYERDIKYVCELNRFFFYLLGIWPHARTSSLLFTRLEKFVLILGCYVLICCDIISTVLYIIMIQKDIRTRLKIISAVIVSIVAMLKYSNLIYFNNRLKNCLMQVEDDYRNVDCPNTRNLMLHYAKIGRRLFVLCSVFMYSTGVTYRTVIPFSRGKIVTAQNVTIRPLPCPAHYVLFDPQLSPAYEIVFFMQCFVGFIRYTITIATCGIATLFTMHICARLEILVTLMNNLTMNERELRTKKLAIIVEYQIKTRNFLYMVQDTIQYLSVFEILACTFLVCLGIYYLIMEWEESNTVAVCSFIVAITSMIFNIFIFCFIGEQLSEQGEKVALTACTLDWHLLPDAEARALILIMLMSNIPMKLKAVYFVDLSLRTFGNVIKTAVGYFNLLRSVVD